MHIRCLVTAIFNQPNLNLGTVRTNATRQVCVSITGLLIKCVLCSGCDGAVRVWCCGNRYNDAVYHFDVQAKIIFEMIVEAMVVVGCFPQQDRHRERTVKTFHATVVPLPAEFLSRIECQISTHRFAFLTEHGNENNKYFITPNGNRTNNRRVCSRTLVPAPRRPQSVSSVSNTKQHVNNTI